MDKLSPERRSANMKAIRARDTKPELVVRRLLHRLGYRYRLHRKDLPGKPDIAFVGRRKALFVHGCFWHQHPDEACRDSRRPRSNVGYWGPKLARNLERDREAVMLLRNMGWEALVLWECELSDEPRLLITLSDYLGPPHRSPEAAQATADRMITHGD